MVAPPSLPASFLELYVERLRAGALSAPVDRKPDSRGEAQPADAGFAGQESRRSSEPPAVDHGNGRTESAGGLASQSARFAAASPREFLAELDQRAAADGLVRAGELLRTVSPQELMVVWARFRQDLLLETFLIVCRERFAQADALSSRAQLAHRYALGPPEVLAWPVGLCPPVVDVYRALRQSGFSNEEIVTSNVLGDPRLVGRLVIPWRDAWRRLARVLAWDPTESKDNPESCLVLPAGVPSSVFGLDRVASEQRHHATGPREAVVVDGILDVLFLHHCGLTNACSAGRIGREMTSAGWEELVAAGVQAATLALNAEPRHPERTRQAIDQANGIVGGCHLYCLNERALRGAERLAQFVMQFGMDEIPGLLLNRRDAFAFVAESLLGSELPSGAAGDWARLQLLEQAVLFDESIADPARQSQLDHEFWPLVARALFPSDQQLPPPLLEQKHRLEARRERARRLRGYRAGLDELGPLLADADLAAFEVRLTELAEAVPKAVASAAQAQAPADERSKGRETRQAFSRPQKHPEARARLASPGAALRVDRPVTEESIRVRAYCLWERAGRPAGQDHLFWRRAEQELRGGPSDEPAREDNRTPPAPESA